MLTFDAETHVYSDSATGAVYPSVTQVIREAGLMGWIPDDEFYAQRGTAVHEATALWDRGELDESTVDPQIAGYLAAWKKFRGDTGYTPKVIEQMLVHPIYQFAGTIDRDGIDIKTGVPCAWHEIQAAAYTALYGEIPVTPHWTGVYLHEDGTYTTKTWKSRDLFTSFKIFTAALAVVNWKREHKV